VERYWLNILTLAESFNSATRLRPRISFSAISFAFLFAGLKVSSFRFSLSKQNTFSKTPYNISKLSSSIIAPSG